MMRVAIFDFDGTLYSKETYQCESRDPEGARRIRATNRPHAAR